LIFKKINNKKINHPGMESLARLFLIYLSFHKGTLRVYSHDPSILARIEGYDKESWAITACAQCRPMV